MTQMEVSRGNAVTRPFDALLEQERLILEATELLHHLLQQSGINRADLARRLGRSKGHVTQLLNGDRNMTLRTLSDLAYVLGHRIQMGAQPLNAVAMRPPAATLQGARLTVKTGNLELVALPVWTRQGADANAVQASA